MSEPEKIDTLNRFVVGMIGGKIAIVFPPIAPITKEQALNLAAHLVALADTSENHADFLNVLKAVENA